MKSNTQQTIQIDNSTFFSILEQELAERRSVRFRIKGISMQPMLRNNRDEVQLVPCDGHVLAPGDICLFVFKGQYILHRLLRQEGEMYYFQGDNVLTRCENCRREHIIGVVQQIYRDGQTFPPISKRWKRRIKMNRFKQHIRLRISSLLPSHLKAFIKKLLN